MYKAIAATTCFFLLLWANVDAQQVNMRKAFAHAESQTSLLAAQMDKAKMEGGGEKILPRTLSPNGNVVFVKPDDWTSGFFPGVLWFLYEFTGKKEWLDIAKKATVLLEKEQKDSTTHDLGFMMYCSFGNGYRLTKQA